jgi:hypothetical protein
MRAGFMRIGVHQCRAVHRPVAFEYAECGIHEPISVLGEIVEPGGPDLLTEASPRRSVV